MLITGHTGFKGAWLALWLQRLGAQVSGVAPGPPSSPSLYELAGVGERLSAHRADVRDYDALASAIAQERPDVVFHLAAQPIVRRSLLEPATTYEINVMGTVNLLDAVRAVPGVSSVVVVTSDKVYANPNDDERRVFVEDDPLGGGDPYSSSKACAELVTAAFRRSFFTDAPGPRVATARAGNVIGGGDWGQDRLVPSAIGAAEAGDTLTVRNVGAVRPWQHVLNPLGGYLLLAQRLAAGDDVAEAWNFGPDPGEARPVRWIVERLAQLWPDGLRWQVDETGDDAAGRGFVSINSTKAHERLGWVPPWNLDDALARVVEWHLACRRGEDMRRVSLEQIEEFAHSGGVRA